MELKRFDGIFKVKAHQLIMKVYDLSLGFPSEERYGVTSQFRRAIISIMLNFVEGHARFKVGNKKQFFEIAYGSCKECKYLTFFCLKRSWIKTKDYHEIMNLLNEVCAMLWSLIEGLGDKQKN